mmetsp:Transcript_105701/g.298975  ORF Transcript_105701/g.298975 Transcript_105701/m.298975 type:complete len:458 (-) Transcript_105701:136-1509(-)
MAAEGSGAVPEIPNDSLTASIDEMSELDLLLTSIENCASQLLGALSQLQSAPSPLLSDLERCYSSNPSCGELLGSLVGQLNACVSRLTCGIPHLEGLVRLVDQVRPQVAIARDAVAARRAAWAAKQRSDQPVKGFEIQETRRRLKAKHDADELFARTTHEAARVVDHLLAQRWPITGTALTELCHCYAGMFASTPNLANELYKSAAKLRAMSTIFEEPPYGCGSCAGLKSGPATSRGSAGHEQEGPHERSRGPGGRGQGDERSRGRSEVPPPATSEKPGATASARSGSAGGEGAAPPPATPEEPGVAAITRSGAAGGEGAAPPPGTLEEPGAAASARSGSAGGEGAGAPPATSEKRGAAAGTGSGSGRGGAAAAAPGRLGDAAGTRSGFARGEWVEVWSRSQNKWVEAVVDAVYDTSGEWENYLIPAGVIKIESSVGVKFITPDLMQELRKLPCFAV